MDMKMMFENARGLMTEGADTLFRGNSGLAQTNTTLLIGMVVFGILFCFLGLKMIRIWAALFGFAIGAVAGALACSFFQVNETASFIIVIVAGVVVGALSAWFYLAGILLVGWILGISVSASFLQPQDWILGLVCVGIGLIAGLIALKFAEPVTMTITALYGGVLAGRAGYELLPIKNQIIYIVLTVVLVVLGIVVQFLLESKKRKKQHLRKAKEIKSIHSAENDVEKARAMMTNLDSVNKDEK